MNEQVTIQKMLRTKFEESRIRNPAFSVRAFAKKAGLSPATLSLILNGKRKISRKLAQKLCDKLMLDPTERAQLFIQFEKKHESEKSDQVGLDYLQLTNDQYQVVADWKSFAILNLIETKGFKSNNEWIARRLAISLGDVENTIERLKRLEMVSETKSGGLKRAATRYRTSDDVANLSLRKSHHQNLELAQKSLEDVPVDLRDFTWMTLPIDLEKMPQAKEMIRKFRDEFYTLMSREAAPTEVYRICVQLFPLTDVKNIKSDKGTKI